MKYTYNGITKVWVEHETYKNINDSDKIKEIITKIKNNEVIIFNGKDNLEYYDISDVRLIINDKIILSCKSEHVESTYVLFKEKILNYDSVKSKIYEKEDVSFLIRFIEIYLKSTTEWLHAATYNKFSHLQARYYDIYEELNSEYKLYLMLNNINSDVYSFINYLKQNN